MRYRIRQHRWGGEEAAAGRSVALLAGRPQAGDRLPPPADRLAPADPKHPLTGPLQERLALGVVVVGELVLVPGCAVGFAHQAPGRPAKVGDNTPSVKHQRDVDVGPFETRLQE